MPFSMVQDLIGQVLQYTNLLSERHPSLSKSTSYPDTQNYQHNDDHCQKVGKMELMSRSKAQAKCGGSRGLVGLLP